MGRSATSALAVAPFNHLQSRCFAGHSKWSKIKRSKGANDVANAAAWAELRAAGVARRCNPLHVIPESVSAVEAAFTCAITCCFPDEPVTLPCGHNFDRSSLEQHVASTAPAQKPACAQCGAELEGGAPAWQGAALKAKVNKHLAAAHKALLGGV